MLQPTYIKLYSDALWKYLSRDALFHTSTEIEVRVIIAGIRGDVELFHLDKIEPVTPAVVWFCIPEKPLFHRKGNWIVAEDEELWIV